jgi:hypothetical protein
MPQVKAWADELRSVFGVDTINAGLRQHGYYASEGGVTVDTRKEKGGTAVTPVVAIAITQQKVGRSGR